ncbi:MAG TPA: SprT family zinc-dependent metalloprotease [Bacteroidales bacterium]|nr:SprT family zinc-dependent metalloprotease [Bacteroidales bacterium]
MQKTISVSDIGPVLITKKSNATRIKLRIHPEKGVLVTIPYMISYKEGEIFVLKNLDWVHEKLTKLYQKKTEILFKPGEKFITRTLNLEFQQYQKYNITAKLVSGTIIINYNPETTDFTVEKVQLFIKKFILKCLRAEGKKELPNRLQSLSEKTGLKYRTAKIGTAGTRLGSCNSRNEIILSARLMLLPEELIDYVILHELCHIVHKNHSEKFYNLLNQLTNNHSTELNKALKKCRIEIKPGVYY